MEGLVLLVVEALLALVFPLLAAVGGLVASALGGVFTLASFALEAAGAIARRKEQGAPPATRRRRRPWILRLGLAAAGVLLLGWVLIEFLFFQPIVRAATDRVARKSGIELSYATVRGWLSTGHLTLRGVSTRRTGGDRDAFDLKIEELEFDARPWGLLRGELSLEFVGVRGARGRYERLGGAERPPRKPFSADALEVADATIDWVLRRPEKPDFQLPLRVDRLRVRPFESADAAFCVLFRGDGSGTLAGAPWEISGEGDGAGRRTSWTADRVPVRLLSEFLGEPFDWLAGGTVDVRVTDAWRRGGKTEVDLRWRLVFRDLRVEVPERVEGLKRRLGDGLAALAGRHPKELPLEFTLTLDERGFKGHVSLEALELWDALATGLVDELAALSGLAKETIRDLGRAGWGKLKGWIERRARGEK